MLKVSKKARISPLADIEISSHGSEIFIDDGALIESFVKIKPAGGEGNVYIGKNTQINSGVVIYIGNGVTIGDNVGVGANTTFTPTNHEYHDKNKTIFEQRFMESRGGIIVEDDVWIGANCVLLDGAILRKGCVVGAHSLVRTELKPYSVNFGVPAKQVGERK